MVVKHCEVAAQQRVVLAGNIAEIGEAEECNLPRDEAYNALGGKRDSLPNKKSLSERVRADIMRQALLKRDASKRDAMSDRRRAARAEFRNTWRATQLRHEVAAGYGLTFYNIFKDGVSEGTGYNGQLYFVESVTRSDVWSADYRYRVSRRFSTGASASIVTEKWQTVFDSSQRYDESARKIFLMASARWVWLDRPVVKCYSELRVGALMCSYISDHSDQTGYSRYDAVEAALSATMLGVSAGRRIYGFAEILAGERGGIYVGAGYRF